MLQVCPKKMSKRVSNLISLYISSLVTSFEISFPIKGVLWIIENKGEIEKRVGTRYRTKEDFTNNFNNVNIELDV